MPTAADIDKKPNLEFSMWHSVGPIKANDTKVRLRVNTPSIRFRFIRQCVAKLEALGCQRRLHNAYRTNRVYFNRIVDAPKLYNWFYKSHNTERSPNTYKLDESNVNFNHHMGSYHVYLMQVQWLALIYKV